MPGFVTSPEPIHGGKGNGSRSEGSWCRCSESSGALRCSPFPLQLQRRRVTVLLQLRGRLVRGAEGDLREDDGPEGGLHPPDRRREPARRSAPRRAIRAPMSITPPSRRRPSSSPPRACSRRTSRRRSPSCTTGRSGSPRRTSISRRRSTRASWAGATTPSSSPRRRLPEPEVLEGSRQSALQGRDPDGQSRARRARRSTRCRRSCS